MPRIKTVKAVEPNVGTRKAYAKELRRLQNSFYQAVTDEILTAVYREGLLAQDENFKSDDDNVAGKAILTSGTLKLTELARQGLQHVQAFIDRFVSRNLARWIYNYRDLAAKLSSRFVRRLARDTTNAQKRSFMNAGISPDFFKTKWRFPVLERQYISKTAFNRLPDLIENNVRLITKIGENDVEKISLAIAEGLFKGKSLKNIQDTLKTINGFDDKRAQRVALDQSCKINNEIQIANCEDIGIKEGIWIHVPGQYTSRKSHIAMHGKRFDLKKGLYDSELKHNVTPGSEPFCRCIFRPVLPDNDINLNTK